MAEISSSSGGGVNGPLLAGIVVHWRDEAGLGELLAAWPRDRRFELLVVDNSGSAPPLPAPARLLRPGRNLGFGGGVNAGAALTRAPLLLILNPDAAPEPGALERLLEGFAAHPEAAGLAPRLTGPGGEAQFSWQLRRLPSAWECLRQTLPLAPRPGRGTEPPPGTRIEQPAGAALALRRQALLAVGGFDERFHPAWFEDVDLAWRLRRAGLPLLYWPPARFRHRLASTVGQLGYGPFLWIYYRNLTRYLAKHHGTLWALAVRPALLCGLALRLALLPLRRPRRAASRAEAARGLLAALAGAVTGWRRPRRLAAQLAAGETETAEGAETEAPTVAAPAVAKAAPPVRREEAADHPLVAICLVTHDSAADLADCLAAVGALLYRPLEIVVVDSASRDGSLELVRALAPAGLPLRTVALAHNEGFAGGMNAAFAATRAPFVLSLNADARPAPDYLDRLLARWAAHPPLRVGAVTGRLLRPAEPGGGPRRLDACGMRLTTTWRHLDRGSGEDDRGQWERPERVFGASGAATLFFREALLDAAVEGEVFDPRFHSFREDAELCFRLRERGWEVLYEPAAVAEHRRFNLPERRAAMPAAVNYHSLKNRYLLRLYHQTGRNFLRTLLPTAGRDLGALLYVLLRERSSLPAYAWLWRHRAELWRRRRLIQARRTRPAAELDFWFRRDGAPL
ncbi:MAG TPA: glycosyltransferase family 2 protein [Thermoanaerobaculia bacterium]|nr:glycosyltransferase family 2 protein [Thermoanaerobaculia bacterium]